MVLETHTAAQQHMDADSHELTLYENVLDFHFHINKGLNVQIHPSE